MITKMELGYVSGWSSKVPYPGIDYATKAVEKLIECFDEYNKYYANKKYDIILSNGEEILFEILEKNLCHILGIDYKNLSGDYFEDYRAEILNLFNSPKSYELIKAIIENIDNVLKYDYDRNSRSGRALNYYRIMIKCSIFEKLSDFSEFNFGVINLNKDTYERISGRQFTSRSEKLLYVQSNEGQAPYFMMGIKSEENTNQEEQNSYVTETLIAPQNYQDFFNGQIVTIPTQILITDDEVMERLEATPSEKIALLNQYKTIIKSANLPNNIDIYNDYESMLSEQGNQKAKRKTL